MVPVSSCKVKNPSTWRAPDGSGASTPIRPDSDPDAEEPSTVNVTPPARSSRGPAGVTVCELFSDPPVSGGSVATGSVVGGTVVGGGVVGATVVGGCVAGTVVGAAGTCEATAAATTAAASGTGSAPDVGTLVVTAVLATGAAVAVDLAWAVAGGAATTTGASGAVGAASSTTIAGGRSTATSGPVEQGGDGDCTDADGGLGQQRHRRLSARSEVGRRFHRRRERGREPARHFQLHWRRSWRSPGRVGGAASAAFPGRRNKINTAIGIAAAPWRARRIAVRARTRRGLGHRSLKLRRSGRSRRSRVPARSAAGGHLGKCQAAQRGPPGTLHHRRRTRAGTPGSGGSRIEPSAARTPCRARAGSGWLRRCRGWRGSGGPGRTRLSSARRSKAR